MDVKHRLLVSLVTVAVIVAGLGSSDSNAGNNGMDGNSMLPKCKQAVASLDRKDELAGSGGMVCIAYLRGLWEGYEISTIANAAWPKGKNPGEVTPRDLGLWCAPKPVDYGQVLRITVKYMEDHPEELHFDLAAIALISWEKAFPCKQGGAK